MKRRAWASCAVGLTFVILALTPSAASVVAEELTPAPEFVEAAWINSPPLTMAGLRGNVVLVEFWTYGCSNCRNVEPYVKAWHEKYASRGLAVVGVHAPEFSHERQTDNVERYVRQSHIPYPVVIDNDFTIWKRYGTQAWPTMYLVDKRGAVRHVQVGEGRYADTERRIQALLAEP